MLDVLRYLLEDEWTLIKAMCLIWVFRPISITIKRGGQ